MTSVASDDLRSLKWPQYHKMTSVPSNDLNSLKTKIKYSNLPLIQKKKCRWTRPIFPVLWSEISPEKYLQLSTIFSRELCFYKWQLPRLESQLKWRPGALFEDIATFFSVQLPFSLFPTHHKKVPSREQQQQYTNGCGGRISGQITELLLAKWEYSQIQLLYLSNTSQKGLRKSTSLINFKWVLRH